MPDLDIFSCDSKLPLESQREFEIFWKKYTGRDAIVIPNDFVYSATVTNGNMDDAA